MSAEDYKNLRLKYFCDYFLETGFKELVRVPL
jgi:hypothetical protein